MWAWILKAALFVGSIVWQQLTAPEIKQKKIIKDKDGSDFPVCQEGSGIPIVFGYAYIKNCQAVYYRLGEATPNDVKVQDNYFADDIYQTVSYNYHCTIQTVICLSNIDSLEYIYIGNEPCRGDWNGNPDTPSYYGWAANAADVLISKFIAMTAGYNYDQPIGAIGNTYGRIDIEFGAAAQTPNSFLETATQQGTTIPAFRGVVQAIWKDVFIGEGTTDAPVPTPPQFLVKRIDLQHDGTTQWYWAKRHTQYGLNVIHAIRELIISDAIGAGLSTDFIDEVSFMAAADICYTDGVGVGFSYSNPDGTVRDLIEELMNYAVGFLYFDMSTAKFKIKLFRDDYVYASLDEITVSDVFTVGNINRKDITEVVNSVNVQYTDRFNFELKLATYSDDASISEIGINTEVLSLPWLYNGDYAAKLAVQTVLMSIAQLHSVQLSGPLELDKYNPGDVFKLTDPRYGWDGIVVRVLEKNRSEADQEKISLALIEDFYGIGQGSFGVGNNEITDDAWLDVTSPLVQEMPYFMNKLLSGYGDPDDILGESVNNIFAVCAKTLNYLSYGLYYKLSSETDYGLYTSGNPFISIRTLNADIGFTDIEFYTAEGTSPLEDGLFVIIDNEIMYYQFGVPSTGKLIVRRGQHDTLPQEHSAGTAIYFFGENYKVVKDSLVLASTYNVKLTSQSVRGMQDPADATANNIVIANRSILPYNGGKFQVNAGSYNNSGVIWIGAANSSQISWAHRSRLYQWDLWISQSSISMNSQLEDTLYCVRIYDITGATLKHTADLINDDEYIYTDTQEISDFGSLSNKIVKLKSKRLKLDGINYFESLQEWSIEVRRITTPAYDSHTLTDVFFKTDGSYIPDTWVYEWTYAPPGDPLAEPSDPTLSSATVTEVGVPDEYSCRVYKGIGIDYWIKVKAVINGQLSIMAEYKYETP